MVRTVAWRGELTTVLPCLFSLLLQSGDLVFVRSENSRPARRRRGHRTAYGNVNWTLYQEVSSPGAVTACIELTMSAESAAASLVVERAPRYPPRECGMRCAGALRQRQLVSARNLTMAAAASLWEPR